MVTRIFVYGTLMKSYLDGSIMNNVLGDTYYNYMKFIEDDGVFGTLYRIVYYPQLLLNDSEGHRCSRCGIVEGEVWEIDTDDESIVNTIFSKLDLYESVENGLFTRRKTTTILGTEVYVYEYTGENLGLRIEEGVWYDA